MPDVAENFLKDRNGDFEKTVETWLDLARKGQTFVYENASVSLLKNDEKKQIADFFRHSERLLSTTNFRI